jgi:hypothetical protein
MAKVIKGTKDRKRFQVLKGQADTRQIRCTNQKCRNIAVQVPDSKGGFVYRCQTCGREFSFMQL